VADTVENTADTVGDVVEDISNFLDSLTTRAA
jgi:hypothetical protein